jgi:pimeloyl-ACP methyl ester carboxylesterase
MPLFTNDKTRLRYEERGAGTPFIFQHGLGADITQPFAIFNAPAGVRQIGFEARGHGQSELGASAPLTIELFAGDLLALMNYLEIPSAIIGGISMGAAIALNFALRYPAKVIGLVLSRPAWLDRPNPFNQHIFSLVAELINTLGPDEGLRVFQELPEVQELRRDFPDTANSLCNQFRNPRARETAANLRSIPNDSPVTHLDQLKTIQVPTLVLANRQDPIHPFEYGVRLAELIPGAEFRELTPKSTDLDLHLKETQQFIESFLIQNFLNIAK